MAGRLSESQVSPSAIVPSCMSSIRLGVTNEKAGSVPPERSDASCVYGTSKVGQPDNDVKYGGGLCRTAYSPESAEAQLDGMLSS